jgi:glycosyltransferase involved in cell wall biosynthesis
VLAAPAQGEPQGRLAKLRRLFDPAPALRRMYDSPALRAQIADAIRQHPPALIHCEQLHVAHFADPYPAIPRLLVEQNIEYSLLGQIAGVRPRRAARLARRWDAWKTRRYEARTWRRFPAYVTVSEQDRAALLQTAPQACVYVVPNGVDVHRFTPTETAPADDSLIMTGTVGYYPNLDGIVWFLREIFPHIRAVRPHAQLRIVGQLNAPAAERIGHPAGVVLTGRVPDVRPYVARSSVFVVPLRVGSGTRLKVLEAMAQGIPVVSTTIGCAGLAVTHEEHLLIADSPTEFAAATTRLLADPALRTRLSGNARRLVAAQYDWGPIVEQLERVYAAIVPGRRA